MERKECCGGEHMKANNLQDAWIDDSIEKSYVEIDFTAEKVWSKGL